MSATATGGYVAMPELPDATQFAPVVEPPQLLSPLEEWVQTLKYWEFFQLTPEQIIYLTPTQVATIPNGEVFSTISAASRAALTTPQVQALNTATISISLITDPQVNWLTPLQIQSLKFWDFQELYDYQIPTLTTAQIATIQNGSILPAWSAAARAALTSTQILALNVDVVGINLLTDQQVAALSVPQIQTLKFYEFVRLGPSQIPSLTTAQIATIQNGSILPSWTAEARAALTSTQIQALNINVVGVNLLTDQQVAALSVPQIQTLKYYEFVRLSPSQIPSLTTAQIATIQNGSILPSWTAEARAALTPVQIQALNINVSRINWFTTQQIAALSLSQIQSLPYYDFQYLNASQIPSLTTAQIATIQNASILPSWTAEARAALTPVQIQALNIIVTRINWFTPQQIAALSLSQIQSLPYYDFQYLNASQIPLLSIAQVASIPNAEAFAVLSSALRGALTAPQVQALRVADVRINLLTAPQIGWLTTAQLQSLAFYDFGYLAANQIPLLSPQQFAGIQSSSVLKDLADEAEMALTREQILALPLAVYAAYAHVVDYTPPAQYVPAVQIPIGPDGLPSAAHLTMEADRIFALVPTAAATHIAVADGNWSDPHTWNGGVPTAGARVLVPAGRTVTFDAFMNVAILTLRIDGKLTFAVDRNTQLKADTIVVHTLGTLHIGTAANPIQDHVSARIVIPAGGPIDAAWDPYLLSRGLLSRGEVRMQGKTVTPFVSLSVAPLQGDAVLHLSEAPTNWRVGDELVIAGTMTIDDFGTDRVIIRAISGTTVTVDPLRYSHVPPAGYGFSVQVANLTRNVNFVAEGSPPTIERPHIMFFHNRNVDVANINVTGFGRTDKNAAINDPVVVGGVRAPGTGLNPRARYAMHFHHTSVNPALAPAVVRGSVIVDSPGWGYVNHSSNVVMEDNVALDVLGASFTTEDGNEIGAMRRNLSINTRGADEFDVYRFHNHDFGYFGNGFWFQGPGVEVVDNIAAGSRGAGFIFFTISSKNQFDAVNLDDPAMAGGKTTVPVGSVPLSTFTGNTAYATYTGLEIWFSMLKMTDGETVIDDFTAWNTTQGVDLHYSARIHVKNSTLVGNLNSFQGVGVSTDWQIQDLTVTNLRVAGYEVGIDASVRRSTKINGADIAAVQALFIEKAHDNKRTVSINGPINITTPTAAQLNGRTPYEVYATGRLDTEGADERSVASLLSADDVQITFNGAPPLLMYYVEQAADYIPFPTVPPQTYIPPEYIGKTNAQLQQLYGVSFNGAPTPPGATTPAGWRAATVGVLPHSDADFDGDSDADGFDFLAWQRGFGTASPNGTKPAGDADGDLDVDANDLTIWRSDFGAPRATAANLTVDEPAVDVVDPTGAASNPEEVASDNGAYAALLASPNGQLLASDFGAGDASHSRPSRRLRWRPRG